MDCADRPAMVAARGGPVVAQELRKSRRCRPKRAFVARSARVSQDPFRIRATNRRETQVGRRQRFRKFALAGCARKNRFVA